jgi:hypothetical protein
MTIGLSISEIIEYPAQVLAFINVALIVTIIMMIRNKQKSKDRYMIWKKSKINLFIYSNEFERSDDVFVNSLLDENQRLENEVNLLKKKVANLSIVVFLLLITSIILMYFKKLIKGKDN